MFVYYIKSQQRLVILSYQKESEDYFYLFSATGENREGQLAFCKVFCQGFVYGNGKTTVKNDLEEFWV